jgi:phosphohistidine phosphatase
MELILWRHAEADYTEPDMTRALTSKGRKQALKTGEWLARKLPESCRILVSPATRAVQTAQALDRKFKIVPALAPEVTAEDILRAANWPNSKEPVLIVGHQPTLGQVVALLIGGPPQGWNIRKGNAWWIAQKERGDSASTYLKGVMSPDLAGK